MSNERPNVVTDTDDDTENGYVVVVDSGPVDDQGTVVIFAGVTDTDERITFGVDHTTAQEMINALGLNPSYPPPCDDAFLFIFVEDWQILSREPSTVRFQVLYVPDDERPWHVTDTANPQGGDVYFTDDEAAAHAEADRLNASADVVTPVTDSPVAVDAERGEVY